MPPIRKDCEMMRRRYVEAQFEWRIADFFSQTETEQIVSYQSRIVTFERCKYIFILFRHSSADHMNLYIKCKQNINKILVRLDFGLQKIDGSVQQHIRTLILPCLMGSDSLGSIHSLGSISKLKLMQGRSELSTVNDDITFVCILRHGRARNVQTSFLIKPMSMERLGTLSKDFRSLYSSKDNCDVVLRVKGQEFSAHKFILMARSPVFAAMFHHDSLEKQTSVVNISDSDPESFNEFLEFLYCGELKTFSFSSALQLYRTADKYDIQGLKSICVEYMERFLTKDNVCDVLILADIYDDRNLLSAAEIFFRLNAVKVIATSAWQSLLKSHDLLANRLLKKVPVTVKFEN